MWFYQGKINLFFYNFFYINFYDNLWKLPKAYTSALKCLCSLAESECHVNRMNNYQEKNPEYYQINDTMDNSRSRDIHDDTGF